MATGWLQFVVLIGFLCSSSRCKGEFILEPWTDNSVRVRVSPAGSEIYTTPYCPLLPLSGVDAPPGSATVTSVTNGNLYVEIDTDTGLVVAKRISDGATLLKQTALSFTSQGDNSFTALASFAPSGIATEGIYGLGEHRIGRVNLLPSFFKNFEDSQLYSQSSGSDVFIPWYISSLGYGFMWDLASYGHVNVSEAGIEWYSESTQVVDFWITTVTAENVGTPYPSLMNHLVNAVGHSPAMPYYTTGFIQCKDRYRDQQQLLDVMYGYIERNLPISIIVIDWQHWVNQGDWSFNPLCWPDPQGMVDEIKAAGVEPMVTFWPFQSENSTHWSEFESQDYLATYGASQELMPFDNGYYLIDEFNLGAQKATANGMWEGYGKYGFRSFWLDAAEPERWQASSDVWNFAGGSDIQVGEAWVQQHILGLSNGMLAQGYGPSDFLFLARSAWVGTWQYSTALWSGDIQSTFDEFWLQVRVAQGVAMSGIPLWTTDIGGYSNGDPSDPVFQDLIVRWFQFGAFCPLFRLHGHRAGGPAANECGPTNGDNEVWTLAQEEHHYTAIQTVMLLRESLRPYVVQINQLAADTGLPMLRPMFLEFPSDSVCTANDGKVDGQYMFGPAFLVAPVTTYLASSWDVYLPQLSSGELWYYWFSNATFLSGQWVTVDTPIEEFPLFYRPSQLTLPKK
ncbi:glycoside hydrolase family 31 protein [Pelomyxa schiedti]|nr:glycoside hydrolase family 31 protein [Pelomyxa schiedti]